MKNKILIVEDEKDVADLLQYNLEKEHYDTIIAYSGEEAVEAVRIHSPDMMLLDIMLPGLNGYDVCKSLRESSMGEGLPIIILTALSGEEARIKGLTLGANDYLSKPFSIKELLVKTRKWIDWQQVVKSFRDREQDHDTSMRYLVHELRNSLSVIGNFSKIALRKDDARKYLKTINIAAVRAEKILDDASLLGRLERGSGAFSTASIDFSALAEEAADMFRDMATKKGVEIVFMNKALRPVRANELATRQVLVNILSNAVKYNRDGGKVWIEFDETNQWVDISITDEGCGVPHHELARIFDKFYRAAGSERTKGTGLGLYIVKLLTEAMGGKITVMSNLTVGSTFTLSLKKEDQNDHEQAAKVKSQSA